MNLPIFPDRYSPQEAAKILGVAPETLAIWRCTKRYPLPYIKKCYSSLNNLTKKCGIARSTVQEHLNKLVAENYINISTTQDQNGKRRRNNYHLNVEQLSSMTVPRVGTNSPPHGTTLHRLPVRNIINSNVNVLGPLGGPKENRDSKAALEILRGQR